MSMLYKLICIAFDNILNDFFKISYLPKNVKLKQLSYITNNKWKFPIGLIKKTLITTIISVDNFNILYLKLMVDCTML